MGIEWCQATTTGLSRNKTARCNTRHAPREADVEAAAGLWLPVVAKRRLVARDARERRVDRDWRRGGRPASIVMVLVDMVRGVLCRLRLFISPLFFGLPGLPILARLLLDLLLHRRR